MLLGPPSDFITAQTLTSPQPKKKLVSATEGLPERSFVRALHVRLGRIAGIEYGALYGDAIACRYLRSQSASRYAQAKPAGRHTPYAKLPHISQCQLLLQSDDSKELAKRPVDYKSRPSAAGIAADEPTGTYSRRVCCVSGRAVCCEFESNVHIFNHQLLAQIPHHSRLNADLLNQHRLFWTVKGNRFCARIVDPLFVDWQRGKSIQYFIAVAELAEIGVLAVEMCAAF